MGDIITKISIEECNSSFGSFQEVSELSSREDVATFLDTFEKTGLLGYNIEKVLEKDGRYIFVYSSRNTVFDFFSELNELCTLGFDLTPQNIKMLFGKSLSRGYYSHTVNHNEEVSTGDLSKDDDEAPTGFIDDEDFTELKGVSRVLQHISKGVKLPINDVHGITIGRSSSKSEYVIANPNVSRLHARVYMSGSKCMVHDFDSANGTYIDGLRVSSALDREILSGSTLILGDEEFKLM